MSVSIISSIKQFMSYRDCNNIFKKYSIFLQRNVAFVSIRVLKSKQSTTKSVFVHTISQLVSMWYQTYTILQNIFFCEEKMMSEL